MASEPLTEYAYSQAIRDALEAAANRRPPNIFPWTPELDAILLDGKAMGVPWRVLLKIISEQAGRPLSENTGKRRWNELKAGA